METSLRQAGEVAAGRKLTFDRGSGLLTGAGVIDRIAVLALQAGPSSRDLTDIVDIGWAAERLRPPSENATSSLD